MESNPAVAISNNSAGERLPPTSLRPLPARAIRTLPTPPIASSSKERQVIQQSVGPRAQDIPSGSHLPLKNKRIESLPPDYYAPHCSHIISAPQQQPYDRSPPPDYYAPHLTTSCVSPDPAPRQKLSKEPNTRTGAASPNCIPQGAPQDEPSSFTVLPEPGTLPVIGSNGNSPPLTSGTRDMKPKAKTDSNLTTEVGLTPLSPVRRQPEASSSSGSVHVHPPSHHQKASKSSSRASMIFRNFAHSPSASSSSLLDNTPTTLKPEASSRSPTPGQSSDGGKYPLPANVANILSHLDPPTAPLKPHPTSSNKQPRNHLPYTSPYVKHTNGASVSYMLSSLAPARDRPSRRSGSKDAHSASNTQSSLSATSVATASSGGSSSKSKSRSRHELKLAEDSASRSGSLELHSSAPRSVSPTNVTALVSSLFAPLAPLPPLAPMSMSSSSSLTPSVSGHHPDAPTGSHMKQTSQPSTAPATQRVAAVSNLLGGLGPGIPAASSHSHSAKPGSNPRGPQQQKEQKHQKNTSHVSESASTSKLQASVSALSMLNPSNLMRPSMDVKPRPFDSSPASSSSPTPSYAHKRLGSSSSRNGTTPNTNSSRNQASQGSAPSTSAAAGWTNPLLALDSKLKSPLADGANSRTEEPSQVQAQTPLHSHLNALTPNPKPNQSSKPRPLDSNAKARGTSSTRAETGGRSGGAFSRLGSMFGPSKG